MNNGFSKIFCEQIMQPTSHNLNFKILVFYYNYNSCLFISYFRIKILIKDLLLYSFGFNGISFLIKIHFNKNRKIVVYLARQYGAKFSNTTTIKIFIITYKSM